MENVWTTKFNKAQFIVGPMVDQSELPFRLLCRQYGAQLCYSPMLHAGIFVKDAKYRKENLVTCESDRPLVVQFCANDPDIFLEAAKLAQPYCDAIDLNLGCPQTIAKRGHYGAFLEDEWDLLRSMISKVKNELTIPITCKVRIFKDMEKSINYAKMLEQSGCSLLAVHGRVKEQKGVLTGLANWQYIKAIKENVKIPVVANGNIQSLVDVYRCLEETGVEGVMSAEGVLHNPALFRAIHPPVWKIAEDYLQLVEQYPCALSIARGHLFKFFHISPYFCQPHFRPPPPPIKPPGSEETSKKRPIENDSEANEAKRLAHEAKLIAKKEAKEAAGRRLPLCVLCPNPKGVKCDYNLCRTCCRNKVYKLVLDCVGHKLLFKTRKRINEEKNKEKANELVSTLTQPSTNSSPVLTCE